MMFDYNMMYCIEIHIAILMYTPGISKAGSCSFQVLLQHHSFHEPAVVLKGHKPGRLCLKCLTWAFSVEEVAIEL